MRDPSRSRFSGPLEPFAAGFGAELGRQGYTANSANLQNQLLADLSRWLEREGLGVAELSAATIERYLAARAAAGRANHRTPRALAPALTYLRSTGAALPVDPPPVPASPLDEILGRYQRYLEIERGLAPGSISAYLHSVRPFLATRARGDRLDLDGLGPAEISAYVLAECPRHSSGHAKLIVTALRSVLGFMHLEGLIAKPLADCVPAVAARRLAGLPRALQPAAVRRMLATCDRRTSLGRRDFAILTTLARLGLRKGELAALTLADVDWRAGEIVVRGKGNRAERLPLPADVGEAIVAYLQRGRPATAAAGALFTRHKAPHTAISPGAVGHVVLTAAHRAGLGRINAHRLRHSAASQMLSAGGSLEEIGQVLRHRSTLTTAIYAKLDREALREIARPWPGATS